MPEQAREEMFRLLQKSLYGVHSMLDDVMALARLQAGQEQRRLESFDATGLLKEMCDGFQGIAKEQHLYLKTKGPEKLLIVGDPVKVRRIVQNLALNAFKYTQVGGVMIAFGDCPSGDEQRWMVEVRDTGPGIHVGPGAPIAEALEAATQDAPRPEHLPLDPEAEPVSDAHPDPRPVHQQQGEGVGLSIVERFCDLLGATLEIESIAGKGTVVRVLLPRQYPEDLTNQNAG